jgi:P-type Ca2+ transporter type 2C
MASRGLRTLCLTYTDFPATAPGRPEDFFETSHDDDLVVNCIVGIKVRWVSAPFSAERS